MGDEYDPTDGDLVRRFAEGDMAAFANLVTRYQNGVFLFFCRMTGRRADAEDLAQETFVRVYESLHSLNDPTRFRSWFWAIASNLCRDYHKHRQRRPHLSIEYATSISTFNSRIWNRRRPSSWRAEFAQHLRRLTTHGAWSWFCANTTDSPMKRSPQQWVVQSALCAGVYTQPVSNCGQACPI